MTKRVRNNTYYLPRLEVEHPAIYADWMAGKYPSLRQALIAAGIKREPRRLNALKANWKKASPVDQSEFLKWVGAPTVAPVAAATPDPGATLVDDDGFLLPEIVDRVKTIMRHRGFTKTGPVMREMGLNPLIGVLGNALGYHPVRPGDDLIRALQKWLDDNRSYR